MPRSGSKSQADRRGRKSSLQVMTPPTQNLKEEDAVQGCLKKDQLKDRLAQEEAEEAAREIMEELLSKVMEGCLRVYIKQLLANYSALWAKSYLTQFVEQHILCLDGGEEPEEASRTEDPETVPITSDAWLQGFVPVLNATPRQATPKQDIDITQILEQKESTANQQCNLPVQTYCSPKQHEKEKSPRGPIRSKLGKVLCSRPPPKLNQNKKQIINSPPQSVPARLLPALPQSAERQNMKAQSEKEIHSAPNHMRGSLHQNKNHRPIPRLDPSHLPQHCILPEYVILGNKKPIQYQRTLEKPSELAKLEQISHQQTMGTVVTLKPLRGSRDPPDRFQKRKEADHRLNNFSSTLRHSREAMVSSGSLRLDKMKLAEGVSVIDPQSDDDNALKSNLPFVSTKLRPIQSDAAKPRYSVEQVTAGPPSQVTTLCKSKD